LEPPSKVPHSGATPSLPSASSRYLGFPDALIFTVRSPARSQGLRFQPTAIHADTTPQLDWPCGEARQSSTRSEAATANLSSSSKKPQEAPRRIEIVVCGSEFRVQRKDLKKVQGNSMLARQNCDLGDASTSWAMELHFATKTKSWDHPGGRVDVTRAIRVCTVRPWSDCDKCITRRVTLRPADRGPVLVPRTGPCQWAVSFVTANIVNESFMHENPAGPRSTATALVERQRKVNKLSATLWVSARQSLQSG